MNFGPILAICIYFLLGQTNAQNRHFVNGVNHLQQFDLDSAEFYLVASQKYLTDDLLTYRECELYLITISALRLHIPEALEEIQFFEAEHQALLQNNSDLFAIYLASKGIIYAIANRLHESQKLLTQAWKSGSSIIRENCLVPGFLAYNIHLIYNLDSAKVWYELYKEKVIEKYGKNSTAMSVYYAYLGAHFQYIGEWVLAESYLDKAIKLARASDNPTYFLPLFLRWQATYFMNKLDIIPDPHQKLILLEKAIKNCQLCKQYAKGYPYKLANCYTMLGRALHYFERNEEANNYFAKAVQQMNIAMPFANDELINIYGEYAKFLKSADLPREAVAKLEKGIQQEVKISEQNNFPKIGMASELYYEMALIKLQQGALTESLYNIQVALLLHNHKSKDFYQNLDEPSIKNIAKYREALEYQSLKIKILYQLYLSEPAQYLPYFLSNGKLFDQLFYEIYDQLSYDWSKHSLQDVVYSTYSILIDVLYEQYRINKQDLDFNQALVYSEKTRAIRLRENRFGENPADIKEVFNKIDQINPKQLAHISTCWIEYFWGDQYIYAFVGHEDQLQFKRLGYTKNFHKLISRHMTLTKEFPKTLLSNPADYRMYHAEYIQSGQQLYGQLLEPLDLPDTELTIIPQNILQSLSFQSLVMEADTLDQKVNWDLKYLGRHYTLTYMPTITYNPDRASTNEKVNVFRGGYQTKFLRNSKSESIELTKSYKSSLYDLRHLFKKKENTNSATHIIAHTEIDSSGDAYLWINDQLKEFFPPDSIRLDCNLLTLATCESNVGKIDQGEGLMSLSYNCMKLGAKSVISSLWKINDASTSDIILSTYASSASHSIPQALQRAQNKYLEEASSYYRHPYYWAGFQYHGNPANNLILQKKLWTEIRPSHWIYLFSGIIGITMLVAFLILNRKSQFTES